MLPAVAGYPVVSAMHSLYVVICMRSCMIYTNMLLYHKTAAKECEELCSIHCSRHLTVCPYIKVLHKGFYLGLCFCKCLLEVVDMWIVEILSLLLLITDGQHLFMYRGFTNFFDMCFKA